MGIPTRDRPVLVRRALSSLVRNDVTFGRDSEFVVVDDGDADSSSGPLTALLRPLAAEHGRRVRLSSRVRRREFARVLARHAGVPEEVVRFALEGDPRCGARFGAPRNALLLGPVTELRARGERLSLPV